MLGLLYCWFPVLLARRLQYLRAVSWMPPRAFSGARPHHRPRALAFPLQRTLYRRSSVDLSDSYLKATVAVCTLAAW